jgi:hypothetical protein
LAFQSLFTLCNSFMTLKEKQEYAPEWIINLFDILSDGTRSAVEFSGHTVLVYENYATRTLQRWIFPRLTSTAEINRWQNIILLALTIHSRLMVDSINIHPAPADYC